MYLLRQIDEELTRWMAGKEKKPLLINRARQIGKSNSMRHLAEQFNHFLEVNFEARRLQY
jgi:hypothetical protein